MSDIAKKLRDVLALAAGSCDPEFNRALREAAAEIERLRAMLSWMGDYDPALVDAARERFRPNEQQAEIQHCGQCGAEIPPGDFHACPGLPGENQW